MLKLVYKIARYVFIVHDNIAFYFTEGVVDLEKKIVLLLEINSYTYPSKWDQS